MLTESDIKENKETINHGGKYEGNETNLQSCGGHC